MVDYSRREVADALGITTDRGDELIDQYNEIFNRMKAEDDHPMKLFKEISEKFTKEEITLLWFLDKCEMMENARDFNMVLF
jgi:hypothetical protein